MSGKRKTPHTQETYTSVVTHASKESASTSRKMPRIIHKRRSQLSKAEGKKSTVKCVKKSDRKANPSTSAELDLSANNNEEVIYSNEMSAHDSVVNNNQPKTNWLTELITRKIGHSVDHSRKRPENEKELATFDETPHSSEQQVPHEGEGDKEGSVVIGMENYQIPMKHLREAFIYVGHKYEITNKTPKSENAVSIQARCLTCNKMYYYQNPSNGGVSNLTRHLKKYHPEKYDLLDKNQAIIKEKAAESMKVWLNPTKRIKFETNDSRQMKINKALQYCIAKDKLPISFVAGEGFDFFMKTVEPKYTIPSRATIQRRFEYNHKTEVLPALKETLKNVTTGIISLDGWKSRRNDGILAFKFHFIDRDWNLRNLTIGIREINEAQTGEVIRSHFEQLIAELELKNKVSMVLTDSGANMVKAFKPPDVNLEEEFLDSSCESDDDSHDPVEVSNDEIFLYCESEHEEEQNKLYETNSIDIFSAIQPLLGSELSHLRCTSHQLQLAMNKGLQARDVATFLAYVNKIIKFFTHNVVYLAKLRKIAGKGLLKLAQTRWNYWVDAVSRISEDKVYQAVDQLIREAHGSFKGERKNGLPRKLKNADKRKMKEFCLLLRPFAVLTDVFQGDGITSSILINSLVSKLTDVRTMDAKYFPIMQNEIVSQIIQRFDPIVNNPIYIFATALDPRMKLNVFKLKDTGGLSLPTYNDAKKLCDTFFGTNHAVRIAASDILQPVEVTNFIDKINQRAQVDTINATDCIESELDMYLKSPMLQSTGNVLLYWKSKEQVYPNLSSAAKLYLALPASSGSVERLFSELSAIGRAKRACTRATSFEQLVLHAQHVDESKILKYQSVGDCI
ncbi:unnamed protein product [Allacma fusca]|uniref:Uncharacterized protein n=1 Tax=Allacma fusca TaxID=39272 RepID=A0A8J2L0C6_9HEXA|nr:unnamed protein product [Allacma fusca]